MCPRGMRQSHIVSSFSVAAEASLTIMLSVNLYKFVVCSPLTIFMKPLVILIPSFAPETYTLELPKPPTGEYSSLNSERVEHS